jgi:hypothetical protein
LREHYEKMFLVHIFVKKNSLKKSSEHKGQDFVVYMQLV